MSDLETQVKRLASALHATERQLVIARARSYLRASEAYFFRTKLDEREEEEEGEEREVLLRRRWRPHLHWASSVAALLQEDLDDEELQDVLDAHTIPLPRMLVHLNGTVAVEEAAPPPPTPHHLQALHLSLPDTPHSVLPPRSQRAHGSLHRWCRPSLQALHHALMTMSARVWSLPPPPPLPHAVRLALAPQGGIFQDEGLVPDPTPTPAPPSPSPTPPPDTADPPPDTADPPLDMAAPGQISPLSTSPGPVGVLDLGFDLTAMVQVVQGELASMLAVATASPQGVCGGRGDTAPHPALGQLAGQPMQGRVLGPTGHISMPPGTSLFGYWDVGLAASGLTHTRTLRAALHQRGEDVAEMRRRGWGVWGAGSPPQQPSWGTPRWGPQWEHAAQRQRDTARPSPQDFLKPPVAPRGGGVSAASSLRVLCQGKGAPTPSEAASADTAIPPETLHTGEFARHADSPLHAQRARLQAASTPPGTPPRLEALPGDAVVSFARQEAVRRAFQHAWHGYTTFALGSDALRPVSRQGEGGDEGLCKMGMTVVDALDTALVMGLPDVFRTGLAWVSEHLTVAGQANINLFETTIRILGGLLSAFAMSGEGALLEKATLVADALVASGAFDTPWGIPKGTVTLPASPADVAAGVGGSASNPAWVQGHSSVAEALTLQLEFEYLSRATGDTAYATLADEAVTHLHWVLQGGAGGPHRASGLWNAYLDPTSGKVGRHFPITLGARGDSAYEYFLKLWLSRGMPGDSSPLTNTTAVGEAVATAVALLGDVTRAAQTDSGAATPSTAPAVDMGQVAQALGGMRKLESRQGGSGSRPAPASAATGGLALDLYHASVHGILSRLLRNTPGHHLQFLAEVPDGGDGFGPPPPRPKRGRGEGGTGTTPPRPRALLRDAMARARAAPAGQPTLVPLLRELGQLAAAVGVQGPALPPQNTEHASGADVLRQARHAAAGQHPPRSGKMDHLACFLPGVLALGAAHGAGVNTSLWAVHTLGHIAELTEAVLDVALPGVRAGGGAIPRTAWLAPDVPPAAGSGARDAATPALDTAPASRILTAVDGLQKYTASALHEVLRAHKRFVGGGGAGGGVDTPQARLASPLTRMAGWSLPAGDVQLVRTLETHAEQVFGEVDTYFAAAPAPDATLHALLATAAELAKSCMTPYTLAETGLGPEISTFEDADAPPASVHHSLAGLVGGTPLPHLPWMAAADAGVGGSGTRQGVDTTGAAQVLSPALRAAVLRGVTADFARAVRGGGRIPPHAGRGDTSINKDAAHSLLRPETAESLLVLWRVTHDPQYREWGWRIFQALQMQAKVVWGGFTSVKDVRKTTPAGRALAWLAWDVPSLVQAMQRGASAGRHVAPALPRGVTMPPSVLEDIVGLTGQPVFNAPEEQGQEQASSVPLAPGLRVPESAPATMYATQERRNLRDSMESFFLAETLKYLYLLFSDDDVLPLSQWSLNTEAHPLPVFPQVTPGPTHPRG